MQRRSGIGLKTSIVDAPKVRERVRVRVKGVLPMSELGLRSCIKVRIDVTIREYLGG